MEKKGVFEHLAQLYKQIDKKAATWCVMSAKVDRTTLEFLPHPEYQCIKYCETEAEAKYIKKFLTKAEKIRCWYYDPTVEMEQFVARKVTRLYVYTLTLPQVKLHFFKRKSLTNALYNQSDDNYVISKSQWQIGSECFYPEFVIGYESDSEENDIAICQKTIHELEVERKDIRPSIPPKIRCQLRQNLSK